MDIFSASLALCGRKQRLPPRGAPWTPAGPPVMLRFWWFLVVILCTLWNEQLC